MNGYLVLVRHMRGDVPVLYYPRLDTAKGAANTFRPHPGLNQYVNLGTTDVGRPISCDVVRFWCGYPKEVIFSRPFRADFNWEQWDD